MKSGNAPQRHPARPQGRAISKSTRVRSRLARCGPEARRAGVTTPVSRSSRIELNAPKRSIVNVVATRDRHETIDPRLQPFAERLADAVLADLLASASDPGKKPIE